MHRISFSLKTLVAITFLSVFVVFGIFRDIGAVIWSRIKSMGYVSPVGHVYIVWGHVGPTIVHSSLRISSLMTYHPYQTSAASGLHPKRFTHTYLEVFLDRHPYPLMNLAIH